MAKRLTLPPDNIAEWIDITIAPVSNVAVFDWVDDEMVGHYYVRTMLGWPRNHYQFCFESEDDAMWFRLRWG